MIQEKCSSIILDKQQATWLISETAQETSQASPLSYLTDSETDNFAPAKISAPAKGAFFCQTWVSSITIDPLGQEE